MKRSLCFLLALMAPSLAFGDSRVYRSSSPCFQCPADWGSYSAGDQLERFTDTPSAGSWCFYVRPGADYAPSLWWHEQDNRSTAVGVAVLDGDKQLATYTVNQQLTPAANAKALGLAVAGDRLALGTFTVATGPLIIRLQRSAGSAGYIIADTAQIDSAGPLPYGSRIVSATVNPSGRTVTVLTDRNIPAIATHPTLTIDGSATPLSGPVASNLLPYALYPLPAAVAPTSKVTLDVPDLWVADTSGAGGLAVDNRSGAATLLPFSPGPRTMVMGVNVGQPSSISPLIVFQNVAKQADALWGNYAPGPLGYPAAIAGDFVTSLVVNPQGLSDPNVVGYEAGPTDGPWTFLWKGTADVSATPLGAVASAALPPDDKLPDGSTRRTFRIRGPTGAAFGLVIRPGTLSDLRVYPPGTSDPDATFSGPYRRMTSGFKCFRFMDALGTNTSNVVEFADLAVPGQLSYATPTDQRTTALASFDSYANQDGYFWAGQVPMLVTTQTPHGLKEGQHVSFSADVPPAPVGTPADSIALANATFIVHVVSPTGFAIARPLDSGNAPVPGQAVAHTPAAGSIASPVGSGWPLAACVELCNLHGADAWINVPHAASDDCVSKLFAFLRANLKPGLAVHCEYSNETWNTSYAFQQTGFTMLQGGLAKLTGDQWHARRSGQVWALAEAAFGRPIVRTMGAQAGWPEGPGLARLDYCKANGIRVDELAIAPYQWNGPADPAVGKVYAGMDQEQFMDVSEWYVRYSGTAQLLDRHTSILKARFPNARLVCYEGGPEYGGLAGPGDLPARSRAWAKHPRMRWVLLNHLQQCQDHGVSLYCHYTLGGAYGSIVGRSDAVWPVYTSWDMRDGLGDGSDGLFDNRTAYDSPRAVSVIGGALKYWNSFVPGPAAATALDRAFQDLDAAVRKIRDAAPR